MKVAFISDIHFGARGDSELFFNATKVFLQEVFFTKLIEENIQHVFLLGDIWDKRKIININILNQTLNIFFDRLEHLNISVYILYGNHDTFFKNTNEINSINPILSKYRNVKIVPTTDIIELEGIKFGMVSWINPTNKAQKLEWIKNCKTDLLLGHFEIQNIHLPDGTEYVDGLDPSLFSGFEYVVSGHYHNRTFNGKIYYLGSPVEFTWNDYGVKKGFTLFDCSNRTFEFVENPQTIHERIVYDEKAISVLTFPYEKYSGKIITVYIPSFLQINTNQYNLFIDSLSQYAHTLDTKELHSEFIDLGSIEDNLSLSDTTTLIDSYIDTVFSSYVNVDLNELRAYVKSLYKIALSADGSLS